MSDAMRIPVAAPVIEAEDIRLVSAAVESGWVSSIGPYVGEFENQLAAVADRRYALATANGTVALHLALAALGIGPGDEVIVPTLTFVATANAVRYTGARPVFADVAEGHWCLSPDTVAPHISARTRAVIPVDLYGQPAEYDSLLPFCRERHLLLIADAAESLGATYAGRPAGAFGDAAVFSFYGNKIITSGEGGCVLTDDPDLYARSRHLRDQAMSQTRRYWHDDVGFNYRLTNIQAALGVAQLGRVDRFLEAKKTLAVRYRDALEPLGLVFQDRVPESESSNWMTTMLCRSEEQRHDIVSGLAQAGIETRPIFCPVHLMPPYAGGSRALPTAEDIGRRGVSLPSGAGLSRDEQERVIDGVCALVHP